MIFLLKKLVFFFFDFEFSVVIWVFYMFCLLYVRVFLFEFEEFVFFLVCGICRIYEVFSGILVYLWVMGNKRNIGVNSSFEFLN